MSVSSAVPGASRSFQPGLHRVNLHRHAVVSGADLAGADGGFGGQAVGGGHGGQAQEHRGEEQPARAVLKPVEYNTK